MKTRIGLLYLCFLVSGVSALVYEIVWQRMLTLVFGVSTWSIAAVLTAYMGGLALGAWAFGRAADRAKNVARLYGLIELGIAVAGLAVSHAIAPLMAGYVSIAHAVEPGFYLSNLIRFVLALAAFIVPCTLIGATVPVMSRIVTRHLGSVGVGFGRFYAINTFGAVCGAALAGFFLIRLIGTSASIYVAVGGNVLVAVVAMIVGSVTREPSTLVAADVGGVEIEPSAESKPDHTRIAMVIAGIVGLTGLGCEVAWTRLLAVYTLNSVYVFTMILTVFLTGLALGSAVMAWVMRRWKIDLLIAIAVVQMVLAMTCPAVLAYTRAAVDVGYEYQYQSGARVFCLEYMLAAVVGLVPTVLMGMTLPMLVALVSGGSRAPGRTVGTIYAVNSVGTIIGSAITGVALIPLLGLRATLMVFAVGNFCVGAWAANAAPERQRVKWRMLTPGGAVCLVVLSLLAPFGSQFIRPPADDDAAILYYAEGSAAIVHIAETEAQRRRFRVLYVDSQSVAGTSDEIVTDQKMLAHLPLVLHPDPQRALTVGFGTGGTSYSMLVHGVKTHCVEIEKAVPAGARFFVEQNYGVVGLQQGLDPNRADFRLILDDARSWLHLATEPYDVIVDDLTSIQYRGNGNLYTVECFELIKRKLTPHGVGCAWVPITGVDPGPLRTVVRSFRAVFPHTSIWYMNNLVNDFIILVGTPERLTIDLADWDRRMSDPDIAEDLAIIHLEDPVKLAFCLLVSEGELDRFLGEGPLHTDDKPILDYLTHAGVYHDTLAENLRALMACRADVRKFITTRPEWMADEVFDEQIERWSEAVGYLLNGHAFKREGNGPKAADAYRRAAELVPEDAGLAKLAGLPMPEDG